MASQLLSLSLFMMLLAFFIVLNALSSFEEKKASNIMDSIEDVFAARLFDQGMMHPSVSQSDERALEEGDTLERLEALFNTQIPGTVIEKNKENGVMNIHLSWFDFYSALMAIDQGQRVGAEGAPAEGGGFSQGAVFLPTLIGLVRSDQMGVPYHMDITLNIPENPASLQNQAPQSFLLLLRKVSETGARLEELGVPARLVTVGLQQGEKDTVDLYFRPHIPFNPLGDEGAVPLPVEKAQ